MVMKKTFNVFLTGYGPFPDGRGGHFDRNASHEMTRLLPSSLPARSSSNPGQVPINIINPTAADGKHVKTEYKYVRDFCKQLHNEDEDESIHLYVHVGMAYGWDWVTVERMAYREDMTASWQPKFYQIQDDIGETVSSLGPCPWTDLPIALAPKLDIDTVVGNANAMNECRYKFDPYDQRRGRHPSKPLRIQAHNDAGNYLCGFIYYESQANRYRKEKNGNVLFCHIPGDVDTASLERARDAIVAIIAATAEEMTRTG